MSNHLWKEDGGVFIKVSFLVQLGNERTQSKDKFEVSDKQNTEEPLGRVKFYWL